MIVHYNGTMWTQDPMGGVVTTNTLLGAWAANANSVWAVGLSGTIVTYKGFLV